MNNYKNFMHSIIDETFKYLFSLFGQGLASERSHPNSRMIILHLFQSIPSTCYGDQIIEMTSYAVLCVSVCCLDDECVVEWEWMDGQKSSKNEANCPACFLEGSNVAKELLNFTNSGS